ncbi:interferon-stimulated 20 kDa exonuclease-like 2 [Chanos chanos]|uniref:Interferon-stimulated 20 kDa exonuclease-like 2 n=1 Tax=Chanos chanos TaxID=29144 RepID=A0A6J2VZ82_CHACN|nr:interferon-stimulated 20 kDa exonuclease-like 2 [Chanos chanos]
MSGVMLNLSHSDEPSHDRTKDRPAGNAKHRRFLKKRRFLEQKGLLRDKQNSFKNRQNQQNFKKSPKPWKQPQPKQGECSSQPCPVFPKFVSAQPGLSVTSSTSAHTSSVKNNLGSGNAKILSSRPSSAALTSAQGSAVCSASQSQTLPALPSLKASSLFGNPLKYVAMDCEMVGTGEKGRHSELARCSIVSYSGDVVYDKYIKPVNPVTDLRTRFSGIRWHHLRNATPFPQAKKEILKILSGKVIIGHAIYNDFKVLSYSHPPSLVRDTSHIPILNTKAGLSEDQPASLKKLTKALFNKDIQVGRKGHSSVEDAKATMELYKLVEVEWEGILASNSVSQTQQRQQRQ